MRDRSVDRQSDENDHFALANRKTPRSPRCRKHATGLAKKWSKCRTEFLIDRGSYSPYYARGPPPRLLTTYDPGRWLGLFRATMRASG
jgi:hypothetical protein